MKQRAKDNLPAFLFYPNDWLADENLIRCSLAAQGAWVRLLCLMWKCSQRGRLMSDRKPWTAEEAALAVAGDSRVGAALLQELTHKGVLRVSARRGIFWSARMVRDELARQRRVRLGAKGGLTKASRASSAKAVATPLAHGLRSGQSTPLAGTVAPTLAVPLANTLAKGVAPPLAKPCSSSSSSSSSLSDGQTDANAPENFRRKKPDEVILALEARMGRQARLDEVRGIVELRQMLTDSPVVLQATGQPADPDVVLMAAVSQLNADKRLPMAYLKACVGTARADGCLPGDAKAELAERSKKPSLDIEKIKKEW